VPDNFSSTISWKLKLCWERGVLGYGQESGAEFIGVTWGYLWNGFAIVIAAEIVVTDILIIGCET
jgi:hypothetical protein